MDAQHLTSTHGRMSCSACLAPGDAPGATRILGRWRMDNNPGYWGASDPEVLVLGFSKGANQSWTLAFDRIAFNGARQNLREILAALELMSPGTDIDAHFTSAGRTFGFASVVRCGLSLETEPGRYKTSGDVVRKAVEAGSPVREIFDRCTALHLSRLPASVRTVVFLGLDEPYIDAVFRRMSTLRPAIRRHGPLSYGDDEVTFVHVMHPSPLATSHRQNWLKDDGNPLARKREEASTALGTRPISDVEVALAPSGGASQVDRPREAYTTPTVRVQEEEVRHDGRRKGHDLAVLLRGLMNRGTLQAREVGTPGRTGATNGKLLRLRRDDGHEFAVDLTVEGCHVWSSLPSVDMAGVESVDVYTENRPRHSGLNVMSRLRGPDARRGTRGVRASYTRFRTIAEAADFIVRAP